MHRDERGGSIVGRGAAVLMALVLVAMACHAQAGPRGYPTSTRLGNPGQDTALMILQYGRSLREGFNTEEGAGDAQRLLVGECSPESATCTSGPFSIVQPRARRGKWEVRNPRDSGEIVARIISDRPYTFLRAVGADTLYKFNIHGRDTVYWWIGPRRSGDTALVSIFVSTRSRHPLRSNLSYARPTHEPGYWQLALARWIWTYKDEAIWVTCDGGRCCRSDGTELQ